eukprot:jgi/Mesvir1/975/Mv17523-RA.1
MKYNMLGGKLNVSEVCLGTMTFGRQNTEAEAHEQLDYAWSRGVNFLDTAEMYPIPMSSEYVGNTERFVGSWLEKQAREKVVVATKVVGYSGSSYIPEYRSDPPKEGKRVATRLNNEQISAAVEGSLRRLRTDYIDLYQLHWPDRYVPSFGSTVYNPSQERESVPFRDQVECIGRLIREGKIRHWGLSNETTFGVCEMVKACDALGVPRPISIQNSFSLLHRGFETELAEACAPSNYNIPLLAWSPLAGGVLSGKYCDGVMPAGARFTEFPEFQVRFRTPFVLGVAAKYRALAEATGVTPAQLALSWCKSRWFVGSTIIGATTMEQLKENLDAFGIELSADTLKAIDTIHLEAKDPCMNL